MNSYFKGIILICLAALFWSSAGLMIKVVDLPAIQIALFRSLFAGLFLGGYVLWNRRHWTPGILTRGALRTAFFYMGTVTLFVLANKMTTSANAVFLQYTAPVYVILVSYFFFREKVSGAEIATVAFCLAGMALFFIEEEKSASFIGNIIGILSGIAFALLQISVKRAEKAEVPSGGPKASELKGMGHLVLGNIVTVAVLSIVIGIAFSAEWPPFWQTLTGTTLHFTPRDIAGLLFLGIFQLGFGYLFFAKGARHISSVEIAIYTLLEPVCNPVWTFLGAGEIPGTWAIVGGLIIVLAMVVNALGHR
jgi:drug/metabolite transporter (DMT)-like permease